MAEEQGRGHPWYRREDPNHPRDEDPRRLQSLGQPPHPPPDHRYPDDGQPRRAMAAPVTLPAIQDPYGQQNQQQQYSRSYPPPADPRADPRTADHRPANYSASPSSVNGYPPPHAGGHPTQLPPLQPHGSASPGYAGPPQDARDDYYRSRQPPPQYHEAYHGDYRQGPPPPQARYPEYGQAGAPPPGPGYDYRGPPGGPRWEGYPQSAVAMAPQAAPRQRTSIACRYCRKRKIRCSGYQSAPGGKCVNCSRMNQECVFQPVSSSSSTAFIPISAVPGGVPPGTPLYGAYGQPLHTGQNQQPAYTQPPPPPPGHSSAPTQGPGNYYQSLPSPTGSYQQNWDQRNAGQRRRREMDEGDELRPPPPDPVAGDDPRRRSPASSSNHSSPGGYMPYPPSNPGFDPRAPPARNSPGQPGKATVTSGEERSQSSTQRHSNSSTPAASTSSVMSLTNLVDNNDIDKSMLGKLNRGNKP